MAGHSNSPLFILFALSFTYFTIVSACEGECITGITNVFNGNYSIPVRLTILSLADQINSQLLPDDPPSAAYLDPLTKAFNNAAYATMSHAIFPSFFHGKCQDLVTGRNPPGCPNPDCPVVCGTPGSMVHFYPRLRFIAFNATWHLLHDLVKPGTNTFNQIQANVEALRASGSARRRRRDGLFPSGSNSEVSGSDLSLASRSNLGSKSSSSSDSSGVHSARSTVFSGFGRFLFPDLAAEHPRFPGGFVSAAKAMQVVHAKRDNYVREALARIFNDIRFILEKICGGEGDGTTNGLPYCSWERSMKDYILTFP